MSSRVKDTTLAAKFTQTSYSKAAPALDPRNNKLAHPLNVLVIGASRGIGAGIAYAFAQAGATNIVLAARASSSYEIAAVERKVQDLNPSVITTLASAVKERICKLDILVLNSGHSGPVVLKVSEGNPQDFQDVFNVNVQGAYLVAHHFIPLLLESNGAKTFIANGSYAALITSGHIANTAYNISKFAQARLVEFLAEQYGKEGLLAVAVHPGAVTTEMANKTTPESFRPCKFAIHMVHDNLAD
jgi:NAD(P)-dependent dehydrogenase (short-subunit alcohol dehydrogenase family)